MAKKQAELKNNIEIKHDLTKESYFFLQSCFQKIQLSPSFPEKNAFDAVK